MSTSKTEPHLLYILDFHSSQPICLFLWKNFVNNKLSDEYFTNDRLAQVSIDTYYILKQGFSEKRHTQKIVGL